MKASLLVTALLCCGAAACLGSEPNDPALAARSQSLSAPATEIPLTDTCASLMQRQRDCSAEFIPALVQARVERDLPQGIRARDAAGGRASLVKEAFEEWAEDSKDARIVKTCAYLSHAVPAERVPALRASVDECLAENGCGALTRCAVPLNVTQWTDPG